MRELLPIVAEINDAVVRAHYFGRLAELSGVPADELRRTSGSSDDRRRGAPQADAARSTS